MLYSAFNSITASAYNTRQFIRHRILKLKKNQLNFNFYIIKIYHCIKHVNRIFKLFVVNFNIVLNKNKNGHINKLKRLIHTTMYAFKFQYLDKLL